MADVTVVIPTVSTRARFLERALASVEAQTHPAAAVIVEYDTGFTGKFRPGGATETRNRAIQSVQTEWTAFLDDDDELYPFHLEHLLAKAEETGADLVYPWFDGANSEGIIYAPLNGEKVTPEGVEFGPEQRDCILGPGYWNFIPVTVLVRTELLKKVGGFPMPLTEEWPTHNCEDHGLWVRLLKAGAKFAHLPERTWIYHVHGEHLSQP